MTMETYWLVLWLGGAFSLGMIVDNLTCTWSGRGRELPPVEPPINLLDGVVLPDPDDPRWKVTARPGQTPRARLGEVLVVGHAVAVAGLAVGDTDARRAAYCAAVYRAHAQRHALAAIESAE